MENKLYLRHWTGLVQLSDLLYYKIFSIFEQSSGSITQCRSRKDLIIIVDKTIGPVLPSDASIIFFSMRLYQRLELLIIHVDGSVKLKKQVPEQKMDTQFSYCLKTHIIFKKKNTKLLYSF